MWKISSHIETGSAASLLRDRRGIATTEAVIVIPFFLIVWMGMVTVHHVYEKRLEVQVISEGRAMSASVAGCKGSPDDVSDQANEANDQLASEHGNEASFMERIGGDQPFAWTHTSGGKRLTAADIPELFGGPERTVEASQKFMCNMEPKDGLWDMLCDMMKSALGWN